MLLKNGSVVKAAVESENKLKRKQLLEKGRALKHILCAIQKPMSKFRYYRSA